EQVADELTYGAIDRVADDRLSPRAVCQIRMHGILDVALVAVHDVLGELLRDMLDGHRPHLCQRVLCDVQRKPPCVPCRVAKRLGRYVARRNAVTRRQRCPDVALHSDGSARTESAARTTASVSSATSRGPVCRKYMRSIVVVPLPGSSRCTVIPMMRPYGGTSVPSGIGGCSMPTRRKLIRQRPSEPRASRACSRVPGEAR